MADKLESSTSNAEAKSFAVGEVERRVKKDLESIHEAFRRFRAQGKAQHQQQGAEPDIRPHSYQVPAQAK
jgi:hypothetical protein